MREDGLTDGEGDVMDALAEAYACYAELEVEHPSEPAEFLAGIHRLQDMLATRVARRAFPEGWARFVDGVPVD